MCATHTHTDFTLSCSGELVRQVCKVLRSVLKYSNDIVHYYGMLAEDSLDSQL